MKRLMAAPALALAFGLPSVALADHRTGEVQEVLIQIRTDEGVKWYKLGKDLKPLEIRKGDVVRFDYADDTIESISVEHGAGGESEPAETKDTKQE